MSCIMNILQSYIKIKGFPGGSMVKTVFAKQEVLVWSLGQEDSWRRKGKTPITVFLPEKSHAQRSLVIYGPWGPIESDTTELLSVHST